MKKRILFVFALFLMLTGFNGGDRIVEQSSLNLQERSSLDGEAPVILEKPKFQVSENGSLIMIKVRFKGIPTPYVTWYHNLRVIKDNAGDRYTIRVFSDDFGTMTAVLEIKDPVLEDDGSYKVNIKNSIGEANATIRLTFGQES